MKKCGGKVKGRREGEQEAAHPDERRDVTVTTESWRHSLPRRQTAGTRQRTGRGGAEMGEVKRG